MEGTIIEKYCEHEANLLVLGIIKRKGEDGIYRLPDIDLTEHTGHCFRLALEKGYQISITIAADSNKLMVPPEVVGAALVLDGKVVDRPKWGYEYPREFWKHQQRASSDVIVDKIIDEIKRVNKCIAETPSKGQGARMGKKKRDGKT